MNFHEEFQLVMHSPFPDRGLFSFMQCNLPSYLGTFLFLLLSNILFNILSNTN